MAQPHALFPRYTNTDVVSNFVKKDLGIEPFGGEDSIQMNIVCKSLFVFSYKNSFRRFCAKLVFSHPFAIMVMVCVICNSVILALQDPNLANKQALQTTLNIADRVFLFIFTMEMLLKIVAQGFALHPKAYLRGGWNVLDFFVVIAGIIDFAITPGIEGNGLSAIRVARVLRPLRTVSKVPSLRKVLGKIIGSLPQMRDVFVLLIVGCWILAIVGLHLFAGVLDGRCYANVGVDNEALYAYIYPDLTNFSSIDGTAYNTTSGTTVSNLPLNETYDNMVLSILDADLAGGKRATAASGITSLPSSSGGSILVNGVSVPEMENWWLIMNDTKECHVSISSAEIYGGRKCSESTNGVTLPQSCLSRPETGIDSRVILNFDNIYNSFLLTLKIVCLDNWPTDLVSLSNAVGVAVFPFFLVCTLVVGYFCVNLFVAVLSSAFAEDESEVLDRRDHEPVLSSWLGASFSRDVVLFSGYFKPPETTSLFSAILAAMGRSPNPPDFDTLPKNSRDVLAENLRSPSSLGTAEPRSFDRGSAMVNTTPSITRQQSSPVYVEPSYQLVLPRRRRQTQVGGEPRTVLMGDEFDNHTNGNTSPSISAGGWETRSRRVSLGPSLSIGSGGGGMLNSSQNNNPPSIISNNSNSPPIAVSTHDFWKSIAKENKSRRSNSPQLLQRPQQVGGGDRSNSDISFMMDSPDIVSSEGPTPSTTTTKNLLKNQQPSSSTSFFPTMFSRFKTFMTHVPGTVTALPDTGVHHHNHTNNNGKGATVGRDSTNNSVPNHNRQQDQNLADVVINNEPFGGDELSDVHIPEGFFDGVIMGTNGGEATAHVRNNDHDDIDDEVEAEHYRPAFGGWFGYKGAVSQEELEDSDIESEYDLYGDKIISWQTTTEQKVENFFRCVGVPRIAFIVSHLYYDYVLIAFVFVNSVVLSLDHFGASSEIEDVITISGYIFSSIFFFDSAIKIVGLGASYFTDMGNVLDFVLCLVSINDFISSTGNTFAVLRTFRLLRMLRLARAWKKLQRLLDLIMGAVAGTASIALVSLIVIYIYAILGFQLFSIQLPGTRFAFDSVFDSLISVFIVVTGEDWSTMMQIAVVETGQLAVLYFVTAIFIGNYVITNLFVANVLQNFDGVVDRVDETGNAEDDDEEVLVVENRPIEPIQPPSGAATTTLSADGQMVGKASSSLLGSSSPNHYPHSPSRGSEFNPTLNASPVTENIIVKTTRRELRKKEQLDNMKRLREAAHLRRGRNTGGGKRTGLGVSFVDDGGSDIQSNMMAMSTLAPHDPNRLSVGKMNSLRVSGSSGYKSATTPSASSEIHGGGAHLNSTHVGISNNNSHSGGGAAVGWGAGGVRTIRRRDPPTAAIAITSDWGDDELDVTGTGRVPLPSITPAESESPEEMQQFDSDGCEVIFPSDENNSECTTEGKTSFGQRSPTNHDSMRRKSFDTQNYISSPLGGGARTHNTRAASAFTTQLQKSIRNLPPGAEQVLYEFLDENPSQAGCRVKGPSSILEERATKEIARRAETALEEENREFQEREIKRARANAARVAYDQKQACEVERARAVRAQRGGMAEYYANTPTGNQNNADGTTMAETRVDNTNILNLRHGVFQRSFERVVTTAERQSELAFWRGTQEVALWGIPPSSRLRQRCTWILRHRLFDFMMTMVTLTSSALLIVDYPGLEGDDPQLYNGLFATDIVLCVIFFVEMLLKMTAQGFCMHPGAYFRSVWNIIDAIVLTTSIGAYAVRALKTVRSLRILRLLNLSFTLRVIATSLVSALPGMVSVMVFCVLLFWIFGVLGVGMLKGRLYHCNDESIFYKSNCTGTFIQNIPEAFGFSTNITTQRTWELIHWSSHFDSLYFSLYTLVKMSLSDNWYKPMYDAIYSTGIDSGPERNASTAYSLYFVAFMLIGNFFAVNLFVGVLVEQFVLKRRDGEGYSLLTEAQRQWVLMQKVFLRTRFDVPMSPPRNKYRRVCFRIAQHPWFLHIYNVLIILSCLILGVYYYGMPPELSSALSTLSIIMNSLFTLELLIKAIAYGPSGMLEDPYTCVDLVVVSLSWVGEAFTGNLSVVRVFRVLRLAAIVRKFKGIRTLLVTLFHTLPELLNVGVVLIIFYFIVACFFVELFSSVPRNGIIDDVLNFDNVGRAFITLYTMATTEGWSDVADAIAKPEGCPSHTDPDCGRWYAIPLCVVFMCSMTWVLMNLLVTVVIDGFSEATVTTEKEGSLDILENFKNAWAEHDTAGARVLPANTVLKLLPNLPGSIWDRSLVGRVSPDGIVLTPWIMVLRQLERLHIPVDKRLFVRFDDVVASMGLRLLNIPVETATAVSQRTVYGVTWKGDVFSIHHHFAALAVTRKVRFRAQHRRERLLANQIKQLRENERLRVQYEVGPLRHSNDQAIALIEWLAKRVAENDNNSHNPTNDNDAKQGEQQQEQSPSIRRWTKAGSLIRFPSRDQRDSQGGPVPGLPRVDTKPIHPPRPPQPADVATPVDQLLAVGDVQTRQPSVSGPRSQASVFTSSSSSSGHAAGRGGASHDDTQSNDDTVEAFSECSW